MGRNWRQSGMPVMVWSSIFFPLSELGEYCFSTAPWLFIMIPKLWSSVLQSLAWCLASLTCTHPWYQHWPLRSSPQLKNGQNCMNIAEKSDYTSTSLLCKYLKPSGPLRFSSKSICSWAGTTLQAIPHTRHGEAGDILAHMLYLRYTQEAHMAIFVSHTNFRCIK